MSIISATCPASTTGWHPMNAATNGRASKAIASGFFVLRTPLLPFDELLAWSDALEAPAVTSDQTLATDRANLRARLAAIVARAEVREAIFVASPSLDEALDRWMRDPDSDRGQRVERAL